LAAIVSAHGPILVRGAERLPPSGLEQYWTAAKCRLDRWARALKQLGDHRPHPARRAAHARDLIALCEEILTGEVLTRVWSAVLCAHDRTRGQQEAEPIARSVLIGHLEARHRVLTLLVRGRGVGPEEAMKLDRLRRRCERWIDMLVGHLLGLHDVSELAIEPDRAREFAADLHYHSRQRGGQRLWPLILASLRTAFQPCLAAQSPNADLNGRIAAAILSCFQPELFDSTGLLRSLWLWRLSNAVDDAEGMLGELLSAADEGPETAAEPWGRGAAPLPRWERD